MIITMGLLAMNAERQFKIVNKRINKSLDKLSFGYRINRASDDAAGLSISEKMRSQIRGLTQGTRNIEDGISLCQTADGALEEVSSLLQRVRQLSVQSANDTNTAEDREAIQEEVDQLLYEIDRIGGCTEFNISVIMTPVNNPEPAKEEVKPIIFTEKNKNGSVTTITIIRNPDGTVTTKTENKYPDGSTETKSETRDAKGNGTLSKTKTDADGNILSKTEGTIIKGILKLPNSTNRAKEDDFIT